MKAILVKKPGGAENLIIGNKEKPIINENELLVKVKAAGINRADIMQREGKYPPPGGASEILGLEISGEIVELGSNVSGWKKGENVFGLIPGGGYAEFTKIHQDMAITKPDELSFEEAAAVPEVFLTAYQALFWNAQIKKDDNVLIHAGASGVGTAAIQFANDAGAHVIITASKGKHDFCLKIGAEKAIDYKSQQFDDEVLNFTKDKGAGIILDFIGADYFEKNIRCLSNNGRLILLATLSGPKIKEVDIRKIMSKWISIIGSTLRTRDLDYQIKLTKEFANYSLEKFKTGRLKPVIDKTYNWEDAAEAHEYLEANKNTGKLVLTIEI
jgi:putative PIG3 family NAD(P)H quinone oxidoreductase